MDLDPWLLTTSQVPSPSKYTPDQRLHVGGFQHRGALFGSPYNMALSIAIYFWASYLLETSM